MATHSTEWPRELTARRWTPVDAHTLEAEAQTAKMTRPDVFRPLEWRAWQIARANTDLTTVQLSAFPEEGHDR